MRGGKFDGEREEGRGGDAAKRPTDRQWHQDVLWLICGQAGQASPQLGPPAWGAWPGLGPGPKARRGPPHSFPPGQTPPPRLYLHSQCTSRRHPGQPRLCQLRAAGRAGLACDLVRFVAEPIMATPEVSL